MYFLSFRVSTSLQQVTQRWDVGQSLPVPVPQKLLVLFIPTLREVSSRPKYAPMKTSKHLVPAQNQWYVHFEYPMHFCIYNSSCQKWQSLASSEFNFFSNENRPMWKLRVNIVRKAEIMWCKMVTLFILCLTSPTLKNEVGVSNVILAPNAVFYFTPSNSPLEGTSSTFYFDQLSNVKYRSL